MGNFSLLSNHIVCYCNQRTLKPTYLILTHMTIINCLIVLSGRVSKTKVTFGSKQFSNNFGCKLVTYIQWFSRSMFIGNIYFLSVYKATIISPGNWCWKDLKVKPPKYIDHSIFLGLVIYVIIKAIFSIYVYIKSIGYTMRIKWDFEYFSTLGLDILVDSLNAGLLMFPEILFSMFIVFSSGSMFFIL